MENATHTRICEVFVRPDEILQINIKEDERFELEDLLDLMTVAFKIGEGKKFKNLILVGENTIADVNAIKYSCSEKGCYYKEADAFVISSLAQKIVANFYMKTVKPTVPTRFFTSESEAETWLKSV